MKNSLYSKSLFYLLHSIYDIGASLDQLCQYDDDGSDHMGMLFNIAYDPVDWYNQIQQALEIGLIQLRNIEGSFTASDLEKIIKDNFSFKKATIVLYQLISESRIDFLRNSEKFEFKCYCYPKTWDDLKEYLIEKEAGVGDFNKVKSLLLKLQRIIPTGSLSLDFEIDDLNAFVLESDKRDKQGVYLTPSGGAIWEELVQPNWEHLFDVDYKCEDDVDHMDFSTLTAQAVSFSQILAMENALKESDRFYDILLLKREDNNFSSCLNYTWKVMKYYELSFKSKDLDLINQVIEEGAKDFAWDIHQCYLSHLVGSVFKDFNFDQWYRENSAKAVKIFQSDMPD